SRERENLVGERTRIVNRMKAALARLGIRGFNPKLRKASERLESLRTPDALPIPPNTLDKQLPRRLPSFISRVTLAPAVRAYCWNRSTREMDRFSCVAWSDVAARTVSAFQYSPY